MFSEENEMEFGINNCCLVIIKRATYYHRMVKKCLTDKELMMLLWIENILECDKIRKWIALGANTLRKPSLFMKIRLNGKKIDQANGLYWLIP